MNKKTIKIYFLVSLFAINLIIVRGVYAASVDLDFSKEVVGAGEQFYVDLMLDTEGESINTIEGNITFQNDNISFIRYEDGKSMVNLWVKKPSLDSDKNTLSFAGVMTNGFNGVIDPFNPKYKLPGQIIRLVFEGEKPGVSSFSTSIFNLNLNNGEGTSITAQPSNGIIKIGDFVNNQKYNDKQNSLPTLDAYVIRDPNVYNNKYVLIFKAFDKSTGIKYVEIKEGNKSWVVVKDSPYLLKDQSRRSTIYVQAMNNQGASVVKTIEPIPYHFFTTFNIFVVIFVIIILAIVVRIIYGKFKKHE